MKMNNQQIINDLILKNMNHEGLWYLYKNEEISLKDYVYYLNEWKKYKNDNKWYLTKKVKYLIFFCKKLQKIQIFLHKKYLTKFKKNDIIII